MKILHIIDPTCGLDSLDTLVLLLKKLPADQHLLVLGNYGWRDAAFQAGINREQISWNRGLARWDPTLLRAVSRCVGRYEPTHLHAWGSWGIRAISRLQVKLPRIAGIAGPPKRVLLKSISRSVRRSPILVITPWRTTAEALVNAGIPPERMVKVSPAVWIDPDQPPVPANIRRTLGQPAREGPIVMLAGWSEQAVRHDLGIWAIGILAQVHMDVWGLLRSDHVFRHEWVNPFAGYASFGKTIKDPGLITIAPSNKYSWAQLMKFADVVAVPVTAPTGLGFVLAAMALGKPIAAFDTPQLRELLRDKATALLAPASDPKELAVRLNALIKDVQLRELLGQAARKDYADNYSPEMFIEQMQAVYAQIETDPQLHRHIVLPAEAQMLAGRED